MIFYSYHSIIKLSKQFDKLEFDKGVWLHGNILCDRTENGYVCPTKCSSLGWNWIFALQTNFEEKEIIQGV